MYNLFSKLNLKFKDIKPQTNCKEFETTILANSLSLVIIYYI